MMCVHMHVQKCLKATRLSNSVKAIQLAHGELGFAPRLSDSKSYTLTGILYSFLWFSTKCV